MNSPVEETRLRAKFTPPQPVQAQADQLEQIGRDFANLAMLVRSEVPDKADRAMATHHLELAYLLVVRGMTIG